MKNLFFSLLLCLIMLPIFSVFAQKQDKTDELMSEQLKAMRVAMITQNLTLSSEEAAVFFPIYNEYSEKRENLRKQIRQNRKENKTKIGKELESSLQKSFTLREEEVKLDKLYFEKFKKVITVEKIMELYRTERQFKRMLLKELSKRGGHKMHEDNEDN